MAGYRFFAGVIVFGHDPIYLEIVGCDIQFHHFQTYYLVELCKFAELGLSFQSLSSTILASPAVYVERRYEMTVNMHVT